MVKIKEKDIMTLDQAPWIEYLVIDSKTYVLLSNLEKPDDFCVRRVNKKEDGEYIVGVDSRQEFDKVMQVFMEKYTN